MPHDDRDAEQQWLACKSPAGQWLTRQTKGRPCVNIQTGPPDWAHQNRARCIDALNADVVRFGPLLAPNHGQTKQAPNLHAAAIIRDAVCGVSGVDHIADRGR
jgi:hypothetical protein